MAENCIGSKKEKKLLFGLVNQLGNYLKKKNT